MKSVRASLAVVAMLGAAVLVAACPAPDAQVEKRTAIQHGEDLFRDPKISGTSFNEMSCSTCHALHAGEDPRVLPTGAPLAGVLSRPTYWGGTTDTLLGSINACLYYFMLANDPWTGEEDEAKAIYAYLESLEAEAKPEEKAAQPFTIAPVSAPTSGDAKHGAILYVQACESCHGLRGSGVNRLVKRAPILPDATLQAHGPPTYTDADRRLVFIEKTRHGGFLGYGGQMPPFSEEALSDQDLADLLAYLGVPVGQ